MFGKGLVPYLALCFLPDIEKVYFIFLLFILQLFVFLPYKMTHIIHLGFISF